MVRSLFPGHRRYSITHRAVQRLRELVPTQAEDDDEALRDRLDSAICRAEDDKRAVRTLDVMLGEPQILVPLETFGDTLYAIIKEDTVVTVLPKGHGEEILQRGQALEQRVAAGEIPPPQPDDGDRWEVRRRWRREVAPPIIERVARSTGPSAVGEEEAANESPQPPALSPTTEALLTKAVEQATRKVRGRIRLVDSEAPTSAAASHDSPVAEALARGLERARHQAAVAALAEVLAEQAPDREILPLWNQLLEEGLPETLTVQDLLSAVRQIPTSP
ncbi:MAG: hypothetical protein R3A79_15885 [Nannocystaceae bacterium]